jgi:O-antigen/teichoic acid export membrane protein
VNSNKKMIRGTLWSFVVTIAGVLSVLGLQVTLCRILGADQFGIYTYVISWVGLLGMLSSLGLNSAALRFIPAYLAKNDTPLAKGFLVRSHQLVLGSSFVVALGLSLAILLLRDYMDPQLSRVFWIGALLIPATAILQFNLVVVQARKKVLPSQMPRVIVYPLLLAALVLLFDRIAGFPINGFHAMGLDVLAAVITLCISIYYLRVHLPLAVKKARPSYATHNWLGTSIPMLINSELSIALSRIDIILVGAIIGTTDAGIYAIASKISQLITFGLKSSNVMAVPLFARQHTLGDRPAMQSTASIAAGFAVAWCIIVGSGLIVFRTLALKIFGEQFLAGTSVLIILCLGKFAIALIGPVGVVLNSTGNQNVNVRITSIIMLCNIVLSAPAIYFIGINGAAIVTAVLITLKSCWSWWEVRHRIGINTSIVSLKPSLRT